MFAIVIELSFVHIPSLARFGKFEVKMYSRPNLLLSRGSSPAMLLSLVL